jgi:hypothetical protein
VPRLKALVLNDDSCLAVVFPEFRGAAVLLFLEYSVEVAKVVEAALVTNFRYAPAGVHQHSGGSPQPDVDDIVGEVSSRVQFEESAESTGAHASDVGKLCESDLFHIIVRDEVFHLEDSPAVILHGNFGET